MSEIKHAVAVFLDRDGVVSRSDVRAGLPFAPTEVSNLRFCPRRPRLAGA